jgi:hypothetical protein
MHRFGSLALLTAAAAQQPPALPISPQELASHLEPYRRVAPEIAEALKLVAVQPSYGFFLGGGFIYTYQADARPSSEGLCVVSLVSFGLDSALINPTPKIRLNSVTAQQRHAPYDAMIKNQEEAADRSTPCSGWVYYERSFAADYEVAKPGYTLITKLRSLNESERSRAVTCASKAALCKELTDTIKFGRLDGISKCAPSSDATVCLRYSFSRYGSLYDGATILQVTSGSSLEEGPWTFEITRLPPPPPS